MNSGFQDAPPRLGELVDQLRALTSVTVRGPAHVLRAVSTCAVVAAADLGAEAASQELDADILIATGPITTPLLPQLTGRRPGVLVLREPDADLDLDGLGPDIVVIVLGGESRWSEVIELVTRFVHERFVPSDPPTPVTTALREHTDLFGLAKALGVVTNTLISIEDEQGRVLAFSPYSDQADPIRKLTILGREPPAWHIAELRSQRVYERLKRPRATVELPESGDLRRRLGVGMLDPATAAYIGTIWAQETDPPFGEEVRDYLVAATVYAARLVSQTRHVHTMGTELVQRMLAPEPTSADGYVQQLRIKDPDEFTVVGFECLGDSLSQEWLSSSEAVAILNLHASSARAQSMVAPHGGRLYAVLPGPVEADRHAAWAERTVAALAKHRGAPFRAAMSSSLSVATVAAARAEVERLCVVRLQTDRTVVTLDNERTAVLLSECVAALPGEELLRDTRFRSLVDYDRRHGTKLLETVEVWLDAHGDIATTAAQLMTHANTVRYRIKRAEAITGYALDASTDRLLLTLQLKVAGAGAGQE